MKSERRPGAKTTSQQQGRPTVTLPPPEGVAGLWIRYGNTALTVILLILAGYLFLRWRTKTAEVARQGLSEQLTSVAAAVRQVRPEQLFVPGKPPADVIAEAAKAQATANGRVTDLVNAAADDPRTRAAALLLRGDLNWNLANLPPIPGAAADPALRLADPVETLLKRSADAYTEALSVTPDDPSVTGPARLGLAAVAENRGDWGEARKQFEALANDGKALAVLSDRAKTELAGLPALQKPLYLMVAPPPTTAPTTLPAVIGPMPEQMPTLSQTRPTTTAPAGTPATMPTLPMTRPSALPATSMPVLPVTRPTTVPQGK